MLATMVIGEPATGKSTLFKALLALGDFTYKPGPKGGLPRHEDASRRLVVFGRYDEPHQFPGTDRLSMGIKPIAMEYAHDYGHKGWHVLFEGTRLGNGKVVRELQDMGFRVRLGVTVTDHEELDVRRALERSQSVTMLRQCGTRVHNMVKAFPELVTLLRSDAETDIPRNLAWLLGDEES